MRNMFYPRLAAANIKTNIKTYLPYILTCIFTIAMFYIMSSLSLNEGLQEMMGSETVAYTLGLGSVVIAVFSVIFLFYTNSFLMKRRKKEFGLFNILGMEKRHIARVIALETLYVSVISLAGGLLAGIALDKAMYMLILRVLGFKITLGFYISWQSVITALLLFGGIFVLILLNSMRQISTAKPIELLQSKNAGEQEPKTKRIMAVLGVLCLGAGYYISVSMKNPIAALSLFFVAVLLVIAGTYLLFTAGSIAVLKLMRKNKGYYYKTKHFTSISGMMYRMKQNSVGLANICILSTMVLVLVSFTSSLMIGIEDIIQTRFPYDLNFYVTYESDEKNEQAAQLVRDEIAKAGLEVTNETDYTYVTFTSLQNGDTFIVSRADGDALNSIDSVANLFFMTLSQYNLITGNGKTLDDGEIFIYSNREAFNYDTLKVFDREYKIAERLDNFVGNGTVASNAASSHFIIVKDMDEINYMYEQQKAAYGDIASGIEYMYALDITGGKEEQTAVYYNIVDTLKANGFHFTADGRAEARDSAVALYGGLFFMGAFLGLLFIMATVLIIYYKQISEGYDDRERFIIMQKVGMSHAEVKRSIHSQIITVFFLPLITAGIHTAFAFPMVSKILSLLNLTNVTLFAVCTVVCFAVFALLYAAIYGATAKVYYKIVS